MNFNFSTDKIIILFYPWCAGGKFFGNCLALSKNAVFQHKSLIKIDLDFSKQNKDYYDWKLFTALKTLPPSKEKCKNWGDYELGCFQLFNWYANSLDIPIDEKLSHEVKILSNNNSKNFFIVAHTYSELINIKKFFTNAKVIAFKNFEKFMYIAINLKNNHDMLDDEFFSKIDYNIKEYYKILLLIEPLRVINYEYIFEEEKFLKEIESAYDDLNYDDYNINLIKEFYSKYISLHV